MKPVDAEGVIPDFDFAMALCCWRKSLGLDQEDIAQWLDVQQGTVSRWEAGVRTPRDPVGVLMQLHELADIFDSIVDNVTALSMRDEDGRIILTTYAEDVDWWVADERARGLQLPASMHQAATGTVARELDAEGMARVVIRPSL